jgi:hypothetical protein
MKIKKILDNGAYLVFYITYTTGKRLNRFKIYRNDFNQTLKETVIGAKMKIDYTKKP